LLLMPGALNGGIWVDADSTNNHWTQR